jgi:uncharacterized protein (TIGR03067 family)
MRAMLALLLIGLAPSAVCAEPATDEVGKEIARLQGKWQAVRGEQNGEVVEWGAGEKCFLLEGNKLFRVEPQTGKKIQWLTVRIDPRTTPKCIDLIVKGGGVMEGIYRLERDTWVVCFDREVKAVKERPTEFAAPKRTVRAILTFQRLKE